MSEEDIKTEIIYMKEDEKKKKTIHQPDSILYTTEL